MSWKFRPILRASPIFVAAVVFAAAPCVAALEDAQSYLADANKQLLKGDLRAAEIQLRNAARAKPSDPGIRLELAEVYLKLGNFPAAEAESRVALQNGAGKDRTDPLLAQALLRQDKLDQVIAQIKPGRRPAVAESNVRLALGLAHLGLREVSEAEPLLNDAARLEPNAVGPKAAMAQFLAAKQDYPAAEKSIDAALTLTPNDPNLLRLQGQIFEGKGDLDAALASFNKVLVAHPDYYPALLARAGVYVAKKELGPARTDVDSALKLAPNAIMAMYLDAYLRARNGDFKGADEALQRIGGEALKFPVVLYLQGTVKYILGQYALADQDLAKYMALEPKATNARRVRAQIALARGDVTQAIGLIKPVVDADPSDTVAVGILSRAYIANGNRDKALELYEKAAAVDPHDVGAKTRLAMARLEVGETNQGLTELEDIAHTDSGVKAAGTVLILADLKKGKIDEAATTAEKLVKVSNGDPVAENMLGVVRISQSKFAEAEKIFLDLIKADPKFLSARRNLAQLYVATHLIPKAKKTLNELLAGNPDDVAALTALATLAAADKNYDEAEELLKRAEVASPKDPASGIQLLKLYVFQKQWDKANAAAQALATQFPDNVSVLELAALTRAESGNPAGALADYQRLADRFPNSATVFEHYAALQASNRNADGARLSLKHAMSIAPKAAPHFMRMLVDLDYSTKGLDAALATARSFAAQEPTVSALLAANLYIRAKRPGDALAVLSAAQQQHPATPLAIEMANLTWQAGKQGPAMTILEAWLKDHADAVDARLSLAMMYQTNKDVAKAEAGYEQVLQASPDNVVALNNLAIVYAAKKDPRALEMAQRAYRLAHRADIADTLGWIMVGTGDSKDALPYLREAGSALPENMAVQYHLAVGLNATGDKAAARTVLERLIKSNKPFGERNDAEKLYQQLQSG